MQNPMRRAWIGIAALGTLLVLMPPIRPAEGVGVCREVNCGQKVPTEKDWKKCRQQDTIKGCCGHHGGQFSATGLTGVPICCWEGTPKGGKGSTTVIGAQGGDVYQSDAQGRPCRDLMGR